MCKTQTLLDCGNFWIWLQVKGLDPNPVTTLIIYQRAHVWSSPLRAKPSSKQWLNWPFRVLDQTLSSVMQEELLSHCRAVGANTRQEQPLVLSWSCWRWAEPAGAVIFCRSLISQFSTCSRWCGTSCSSNISQTCYCLQVQCFAKKNCGIFFGNRDMAKWTNRWKVNV